MKHFSRIVLSLAVIGLVLPQMPARAASPAPIGDVVLTADGLLQGQVVDRNGTAKANVPVTVYSGEQAVGQSRSERDGKFAIKLTKGGLYRLSDGERSTVMRVWTNQTAPPAAKSGVLVVSDQELTRGNFGGDRPLLPLLLVGGLVAGIAVAATWDNDEGS